MNGLSRASFDPRVTRLPDMKSGDLTVRAFADPRALARGTAEEFERRVHSWLATNGRFSVALAGGSTPRDLYELLASEPYRRRVPWGRVHLFWGDERAVPPNSEESNFGMTWDAMISKLAIPPGNVHRMRGELDPEEAAREYERELRSFFDLPHGWPCFDLVLLGMGEDGHTASLFPNEPATQEGERLAVPVAAVKGSHGARVTLTPPVLNHAACIMFLVTGEKKADVVRVVLEGDGEGERLPAAMIRPRDGELVWHLDRAAAKRLSGDLVEEES